MRQFCAVPDMGLSPDARRRGVRGRHFVARQFMAGKGREIGHIRGVVSRQPQSADFLRESVETLRHRYPGIDMLALGLEWFLRRRSDLT